MFPVRGLTPVFTEDDFPAVRHICEYGPQRMLSFVVDQDEVLGIGIFKRIRGHRAFPFVRTYGSRANHYRNHTDKHLPGVRRLTAARHHLNSVVRVASNSYREIR